MPHGLLKWDFSIFFDFPLFLCCPLPFFFRCFIFLGGLKKQSPGLALGEVYSAHVKKMQHHNDNPSGLFIFQSVMAVNTLSLMIGSFSISLISSCRMTGGIKPIPWLSAENGPPASVSKLPKGVWLLTNQTLTHLLCTILMRHEMVQCNRNSGAPRWWCRPAVQIIRSTIRSNSALLRCLPAPSSLSASSLTRPTFITHVPLPSLSASSEILSTHSNLYLSAFTYKILTFAPGAKSHF